MLSHYEIDVSINNLGNFAYMGILWYDDKCSAPSPCLDRETFISQPNIIERILGITLKKKIETAKAILIRKADKHLAQNKKLNKLIIDDT